MTTTTTGFSLPPGKRPKWLAAEEGLKRFDLPDTVAGRRRMVKRLDRRAVEEEIKKCGMPVISKDEDARCSHLRRGWYWGSQKFAGKLRELAGKLMKERTTVSQDWIAAKLSMRSAANVSQQLRRFNRGKTKAKLPSKMQAFIGDAWKTEI